MRRYPPRRTLPWHDERTLVRYAGWAALPLWLGGYPHVGLAAVALADRYTRAREHRRLGWQAQLRGDWIKLMSGPVYAALKMQVDRASPTTAGRLPPPWWLVRVAEHDWAMITHPAPPLAPGRDRGEHAEVREQNRWRDRAHGLYCEPHRAYVYVPRNHVLDLRSFKVHFERETLMRWTYTYDATQGRYEVTRFTLPERIPPPPVDVAHPWLISVGLTEYGWPLLEDRRIFPHGILGGSTRYGKTAQLYLRMYHYLCCILAGTAQAAVFIDPKGNQMYHLTPVALGMDFLDFNPGDCSGVVMAQDAPQGGRTVITNKAAVLQALSAELSRRIEEETRTLAETGRYPDWSGRTVYVGVDEQARLMADAAAAGDRTIAANIDRLEAQGAGYGFVVDIATQAPRSDVLTAEVKNNAQGRTWIGPGDSVNLKVVFDADLPYSPPYQPGQTVTRDPWPVDPAYPYHHYQGYYAEPTEYAALVLAYARALVAQGATDASVPAG
jgi:hypothetical protein